jgi:hypothetical protein
MDEVIVARADLHERIQQLTREGLQVGSVTFVDRDDPDSDYRVQVTRRTEIRDGV